tara:strand:- start:2529 stop:3716 length:1188 start_codon:yes stop_codon:yes gene_type:complete
MPAVIEVISGQANTIKVKPNSVPTVSISREATNAVTVKSSVDITVNNIQGSFTDTLDSQIVVTNQDDGVGLAKNKTYNPGTEIETILRDILDSTVVPTIDMKIKLSGNGTIGADTLVFGSGGTTDFGTDFETNWGDFLKVEEIQLTISDEDTLILDSANLRVVNNHYSDTLDISTSDVNENSWSTVTNPVTLSISENTVDDVFLEGNNFPSLIYKKYTFKARLDYLRNSEILTAESNECSVAFRKRMFVIVDEDTNVSPTPQGSPSSDEGETTVTQFFNGTSNSTEVFIESEGSFDMRAPVGSDSLDKFTYIAIPHPLGLNLLDNKAVSIGDFGIARTFEFYGYKSDTPSLAAIDADGSILVPLGIVYKLYRSVQPGAFSEGQVLTIKASSITTT